MHNTGFQLLGLDYRYLAFDIDEAHLSQAVDSLKMMNARGWNLTMPCKTKMCELVDELSPAARLTHAVNTVVNDDGVLKGYTTDGSGYMRMLKENDLDMTGRKMVLAGAGGAARAIAVQAALDGVKAITIFNRSLDKAVRVADDINRCTDCHAEAYGLEDETMLRQAMREAALFTNATKIGMEPKADASIIKDVSLLDPHLVVSDIVYNPLKTKLLSQAESRGCKTIGGLKMLLWQGVDAFRLWTGKEMPAAVVADKYFKEQP